MNYFRFSKLAQFQLRGAFKQQLKPDEVYSNFKVIDICKSRDFHCLAYTLTHLPTQATYVHLATPDIQNQACLAFRTPVQDDHGLPHVVQQLINSGSLKYPVRDALSHMHGRSLQPSNLIPYITPDYSVYSIQSMLREDYFQLLELCFEQVFNPMFREVDLLHQVRLQSDGQLICRGQIYDTMKLLFQSPEFIQGEAVRKALLQNTHYQYTAGGIPHLLHGANITNAKQYYDKYINISNAYVLSTGDLDILEQLQFFDSLFMKYQNNKSQKITPSEINLTQKPKYLKLLGADCSSFAFRGADLIKNPQEYMRIAMLMFMLHEVDQIGFQSYLQEYQAYCFNYGVDSNRQQTIQIGFQTTEEQVLFDIVSGINKDFYRFIPKDMFQTIFDRVKLNRTINLSDIVNYVVHDIKPDIYLNQTFDSEAIIETCNQLFSQEPTIVTMKYDKYYIEDQDSNEKKHLSTLSVDYQELSRQKQLLEEDNIVYSLESLPKLHIMNTIQIQKQNQFKVLNLLYDVKCQLFGPKHPQQTNLEWVFNIEGQDLESVFLLRELLPELFNRRFIQHDLKITTTTKEMTIELSFLDKNMHQAFQDALIILDPPFDDIELLSEILQIMSAKYVDYERVHEIAISHCRQDDYSELQLARKICGLQVDVLRTFKPKEELQEFADQVIRCYYRLMNKNKHKFIIHANPYLEKQLINNINLALTNLNLQFEDYHLDELQFNEKYELSHQTKDFKYLKLFLDNQATLNTVIESFDVEDKLEYELLAQILNPFMVQFCTQNQQAHCEYRHKRITFYTLQDVNTVKSYEIFENSLHLLLECLDSDDVNSALISLCQVHYSKPEHMQALMQIPQEKIIAAGKIILQKMADGESSQVIMGKAIEQLISRGWKIERYINEIAL